MAFVFRNIILVKLRYKTNNQEFLAITKVFKTLHYYFESYKYKIFDFIDYNKFCHLIDIRNLNFKQV